MKQPLKCMNAAVVRYTKADISSSQRRLASRITTLPLGRWSVKGVNGLFTSYADALAAARRLDTGT